MQASDRIAINDALWPDHLSVARLIDVCGSVLRGDAILNFGDGDRLVIDWESFVAYCERSFSALSQEKPIRPVLMRGMAKIDDYYNYEFSDSKTYLSLKLDSADGDEAVHAFCRRDSEMGRWLINDLGADAASSLTKGYALWVAFPKDAQSNRCLNLVQIVAGRWLSVAPSR